VGHSDNAEQNVFALLLISPERMSTQAISVTRCVSSKKLGHHVVLHPVWPSHNRQVSLILGNTLVLRRVGSRSMRLCCAMVTGSTPILIQVRQRSSI